MTRRGHWTGTSTWTWTRPQRQDKAPRTGLGLRGFCVPCPLDDVRWWCDCCHTLYAYTETRQLSCWNSDALKYNYWEMCDCRLVSVYVCAQHTHTHTYCHIIRVCLCVCVCHSVYTHRNGTGSQAASISIMFGILCCLWMPTVEPALPCPALPPLPILAHPLPLPHNIIIYASKMT